MKGLLVTLAGGGTVVKLDSTRFEDRSLDGHDTLGLASQSWGPFLNCETGFGVWSFKAIVL